LRVYTLSPVSIIGLEKERQKIGEVRGEVVGRHGRAPFAAAENEISGTYRSPFSLRVYIKCMLTVLSLCLQEDEDEKSRLSMNS
jgi:hypothetical protein